MTDLRVVVVDDEALARERVTALVRGTAGLDLVGEARNGLEALDLIAGLDPDLVFVDVEMPVLSGFGIVAALAEGRVPGVVFVTAFDQYAVRAFEVGAIDYLLKPVTKPRFAAAVDRARSRLGSGGAAHQQQVVTAAVLAERARGLRKRYVIRQGYSHYLVPVTEIDWIEAADNYLRLHTGARAHLCRGAIKDAETELDPACFVRIHRSAIVAIGLIETVERLDSGGYRVALRDGPELRASRQYGDRVRALLRGRRY